MFMLAGAEQIAKQTIYLIKEIKALMMQYKHRIRDGLPKIYRQELLNNLFKHPYTKIEFMVNDLGVTRLTATKYLDQLVEHGLLNKQKVGRGNCDINAPLCDLFARNPNVPQYTSMLQVPRHPLKAPWTIASGKNSCSSRPSVN